MMKKNHMALLFVLVFSLMLSACSSPSNKENSDPAVEPTQTTQQMADEMVKQVEQPKLIDLDAAMVKEKYHLDTAVLDQFTVRIPLMNVKTNEIAIFKVKNEKDIPAVEAGVKQRAEEVQKQFETYLPDQYENAKNYKMVTKGKYVLFLIAEKENVDKLANVYNAFFEAK